MSVAAMLQSLEALGAVVRGDGGRLIVDAPRGTVTPQRLALLKAHKAEALAWARAREVEAMSLSEFARAGLLVTVESDLLGTYYLASDERAARGAPSRGAAYTPGELRVADALDPEAWRKAHLLKRACNGSLLDTGARNGKG